MEINKEILDEMIEEMEKMKPLVVNDMSIKIGRHKGYDVRILLHKPSVTWTGEWHPSP